MSMVLLYLFGAAVRLLLLDSPTLSAAIRGRVEVSTPLNSWDRVLEGVYLQKQGIPVYSGGVYHGSPLTLWLASHLTERWEAWLPVLFVLTDLLTAFVLSRLAKAYGKFLLESQSRSVSSYSRDSLHLLLRQDNLLACAKEVAAWYLLCPFTIMSCVGLTTTTYHNLVVATALWAMVTGRVYLWGVVMGVACFESLYPVVLVVPGLLALCAKEEACGKVVAKAVATVGVTIAVLVMISAEISGSWQFLPQTHGFILAAPDLSPNIGLFWYFFTEMFDHFRLFFLAVFQLNAIIYVVPLCVRLRSSPVLLSISLLALSAVFRSYPCLGDVGFYLALLPTCRHLYPFLQQSFLVGCMLCASSVLGPIMYNLWIFSGAANANFYFAVTLAFNTAQIFLVTDLLFGHLKRQHLLCNGSEMVLGGKPAKLVLE